MGKKYLIMKNKIISSLDSVILLGIIEIGQKLDFEKHVSTICRKARKQLMRQIEFRVIYLDRKEKFLLTVLYTLKPCIAC